MPISYLGQYDDNQRIFNHLTKIESNLLVIGGSSSNGATANQVNAIAQQIPNLATGNNLANANSKLDNQAILIGGISSKANSIYSDTQALRNTDIPRLATGNQANNLNDSIAAVSAAVSAGRNEGNAISRNTYNSQLNFIQTAANNANSQAAGANASVQTVRSEQSNRFNNVDSSISGLSSQISGLTSANGTASSVVNLNATTLIVPYSVNNFVRDLIYALGATETGYAPMSPTTVEIIANSTGLGDPNNLINKNVSGWYSTNVSGRNLTLDFGKNKNTRTITINGLGFKSQNVGSPVNLLISGSNDGTNFNDIQTWSGLGITGIGQWKFIVFSNSTAYRYIRIAMIGFNTAGTNQFGSSALLFYGTIANP